MDENVNQKGKKVGADGLTKKERRALKVAAEKKDTTNDINATKKSSKHESQLQQITNKNKNEAQNVKEQKQIAPVETPVTSPSLPTQIAKKNKNESTQLAKEQIKVPVTTSNIQKSKIVSSNVEVAKNESQSDAPSKAELKAQRRAIQEAQRLAKANQKITPKEKQPENKLAQPNKKTQSSEKFQASKKEDKHVSLFNHLYFEESESKNEDKFTVNNGSIHPAFIKLGVQYKTKSILGSNARCLALLSALKTLVNDFKSSANQEFYRSLETTIQQCVSYLNTSRPLAVSMTNALTAIKLLLTQSNINESDNAKKENVIERIDRYIQDDIDKAGEAISMKVQDKISNGDVILTFGYSSLIRRILIDAHEQDKRFKVIVLDTRPLLEGKEMLRCLACHGIPCSYLLINAASFVMSRVTKVLLGAHALLANGYVMSRTGTAQVALVANAYKKPVLVCCENYKFCERAQTDSFVYNEIGDPEALATINTSDRRTELVNWRNNNKLTLLNLMYDVTPSDLVTAVITEIGVLPCTSVPVILRIRPVELVEK